MSAAEEHLLRERIEKLEAEISKRPAKPLYGEARSLLLKAMDNSANVDDAIEKYKELQKRITRLESALQKIAKYEEEDVFDCEWCIAAKLAKETLKKD